MVQKKKSWGQGGERGEGGGRKGGRKEQNVQAIMMEGEVGKRPTELLSVFLQSFYEFAIALEIIKKRKRKSTDKALLLATCHAG